METAFTDATGRVNPDFTNLASGKLGSVNTKNFSSHFRYFF
jgi:hypothetical protein